MLTVTESASAHLAQLLDKEGAPDGSAVRLVVQDQGVKMGIDSEQPGDKTFSHAGRTVLVVDHQVSKLLDKTTLDVQQTEQGDQLTLQQQGGDGDSPPSDRDN